MKSELAGLGCMLTEESQEYYIFSMFKASKI